MYGLGDLQVTDVLVVAAQDGNTSLWIASNLFYKGIEKNIKLSVYIVVDFESGPSFSIDVSSLYSVLLHKCMYECIQAELYNSVSHVRRPQENNLAF